MTDPTSPEAWLQRIEAALAKGVSPEPLAVAQEALRAHPTDPSILHFAALGALVADKPDLCLRYLKRLGKRYEPMPCDHLLRALVLIRQGLADQGRQVLEHHGLDRRQYVVNIFRCGPALTGWMLGVWSGAFWAAPPPRGGPKAKATPPKSKVRAEPRPRAAAPPPPALPTAAVPELPRPQPRIAVEFEWTNRAAPEATSEAVGDASRFWLRGELARLALLQGFDELLCLGQLRGVETYWYQVETVRKVLKQFRGRVLLADEVGLGKTVEAGMVLKEYVLRGMVDRFLILTPASLVGQWAEEMETKFGLPCATSQDPLLRADPERFWAQPRVVASIATARRGEHFELLGRAAYDLVIVDEAHHLKNRSTRNYQLVDALQKRFLLLLSATPVQNSLVELYNLLTLLKPGIFRTEREFRAAHMAPGKPRVPLHRDRMRDLMRDAMIRNTRALVDVRLPPRHAVTLRVEAAPGELACYGALADLVREVHRESAGGHRLALHHLLAAAGSSPAAIAGAIERFAARHPGDPRWRELAARYRALGGGGKAAALLELLARNPDEKKLVFVHHRDTLAHLAEQLAAAGVEFAQFHGGMGAADKDEAVARFQDRVPVLLSTESGGEGRNLQFANTLVNFDLPWNPMAIEQRIGRLHRIGQHREVFVFNLALPGTLEDELLRILDEKINMFELVVGEVGAILGEIEDAGDFSELVFDAWVQASAEDRSRAFDDLTAQIAKAREQYEAVKELDAGLFGDDFEAA